MAIELNRDTFRHLVWLDIIASISAVTAFLPMFVSGRWYSFSRAFKSLVLEQFGPGPLPGSPTLVVGLLLLPLSIWSIVSTVGMLRFESWARFGYWLTPLLGLALLTIAYGFRPLFSSVPDLAFGFFRSGLFGAIVILSYSKGLGAEWFRSGAVVQKV